MPARKDWLRIDGVEYGAGKKGRKMIRTKAIESLEQLSEMKQQYIGQTTAPLDGMWLSGFVPKARHIGFYEDQELIGYYCVNDDGFLLQFYLDPEWQSQASILFDSLLAPNSSSAENINGAFASTAEPQYLSLCLDSFSVFEVNAVMYQLGNKREIFQDQKLTSQLTVVKPEQLAEAVVFARAAVGSPEEWQVPYFRNLIDRQELFGYWQNGRLLAVGECRGFDEYQVGYADLGIIVAESERGRGIGTWLTRQLIAIAESKGLIPICSTEKSNIASQKALSRAGFIAENRIVQFDV